MTWQDWGGCFIILRLVCGIAASAAQHPLLDPQQQFHLVNSICLLRLSARNSSQYLDWILKQN